MRRLPCPADVSGSVYQVCISRIRGDLRARLDAIIPDVVAAEDEYKAKAAGAALHTLSRLTTISGGVVTKDEMVAVYENRMVPSQQAGRAIYDRLITAAPHARCPLCGVGYVLSLDHHLPKAHYPIMAVTPFNLVPSCWSCQKAKKQGYPVAADEQTLHPYFDSFEDRRWLFAEVLETEPASFLFVATVPTEWAASAPRLRHHLKVLTRRYRIPHSPSGARFRRGPLRRRPAG